MDHDQAMAAVAEAGTGLLVRPDPKAAILLVSKHPEGLVVRLPVAVGNEDSVLMARIEREMLSACLVVAAKYIPEGAREHEHFMTSPGQVGIPMDLEGRPIEAKAALTAESASAATAAEAAGAVAAAPGDSVRHSEATPEAAEQRSGEPDPEPEEDEDGKPTGKKKAKK